MKKNFSKLFLLVLIILLMLPGSSVFAGSASGLNPLSYIVQEGWKYLDTDVSVTSSSNNWTDGYIDIDITSGKDAGDQLRILSSGSLSVVGDAISWGGTRIGTIDPTYNGSNGKLRINFSASLLNSGFETGNFSGWTVNTSYVSADGRTHSQTATVQSSVKYEGSYAAKLEISGVTSGYGVGHGPEITSSIFYAQAGNTLSVRWNALDSGDDYDVYGFLVNSSTGVQQQLFYGRGDNTNGWNTINATIGSAVCPNGTCAMQFRFLCGSYDATGGTVIGSTMYIDGISVVTSVATDAAVDYIVEHLEYRNTSNSPTMNKTYTWTLKDSSSTGSASSMITLSKANTSTSITGISPEPSVYGQNYSVSVNVAAVSPSTGTPDGIVSISDGSNSCNATLSNGSGSCSLPSTSIGIKSINASYLGTAAYNSSSASGTHTINKVSTSTTITSDAPDPSVYGQDYSVSVSVSTVAPGSGTPSGTVSVSDGLNSCNITLSGGSGSCTFPSSSVGGKTITATYPESSYFLGSSTSASHTVTKANTNTSVNRTVVSPVYGQPLSLSALVSPVSPATYTPTGPVQFYMDNQVFGGQVSLSSGTASSQSTTNLVAGTHTYYADFLGDANNNGSNSLPAVSFTVEKNSTTTSVISSSPTSVYGQPIQLTATVEESAPSVVTPVGQVQFYFNGDEIGSLVDLVNGVAKLADLHTLVPTSYLLANHIVVGEYSFSAEYLGNSNTYGSSSDVEDQIVDPAATEVTISSSENPSVYGTTLDLTIKVTQQSESLTIPTGQVQLWIDGVKFMIPLTLDSKGEAVRTIPYFNLWPGSHSVTAFYTPTSPEQFIASDNTGNDEPLIQVVHKATPVFTITPSVSAPVASELVAFSVELTHPFRAEVIPTGMIQCLVDDTPLGDWVPLDLTGKAQCPESIRLSSGDHDISVAYDGDDYFIDVDESSVKSLTVAKADTVTEFISVDPLMVVVGQPTVVDVKVTVVPPAIETPTGKVLVSNGVDECEVTLDGSGEGFCDLASTSPGEKTLSASYQGSDNHNTSAAIEFVGLAVSKADSAVSIVSFSPEFPVTGEPVTISFFVVPVAPGWGHPSGLVTITAGEGRSCQAVIDAKGSGECQISFDQSGAFTLNADYEGDSNFNPSTFEGFSGLEISKADTSLALVTSVSPSKYGQYVTFTATISVDDPGAGQPTGYVQFFIDDSEFGAPVSLAEGKAVSQEINLLMVGSHYIAAEYLGDDDFNTSSAEEISQQVNKADSALILTTDQNPSPYGVSVWVTAQVVGVDPSERFPTSGSVQFIVDGIPYGAPIPLNSEGKANKLLPYTALWVGTHPITAVFSGNDFFHGSDNLSEPWMQVVERGDLSILVDYSVESPVVGQSFSISAKVVGDDINNPIPTGTLEFYINDMLIGSAESLDAIASATSDLAGGYDYGSHSVKLVYSGDHNYKSHTVETTILVEKADTAVVITDLSTMSAVVGEKVTVNFSVDVLSPGVGVATGSVTVSNGVDECSGSLTNGSGSCELVPSFSGAQDLNAAYAGDSNFNASTTSESFTGLSVEKASLLLVISDMPVGPFVIGQSFTISVLISPVEPGSLLPVGSVITISNGVDSCEATVQLDGSASCEITPSTLDTLDFVASFAGNDGFNAVQSSPLSGPQIDKANTQMSISTSINPGVEGSEIQFTANLSVVAPGAGHPAGFVQFLIDDVPTGDPIAVVNGKADSSAISDLLEGIYAVKATYLGNDLFKASTSSELSQKIVAGNHSETVNPGQGTTITFHGMQNGQPVTTIVQIPADAVDEEVTVVYHQFNETTLEKPEGKDFVTHFTLKVYKNGELQPGFGFLVPIEISMQYNPQNWDVETFEVMGWSEPDVKGWQSGGIEIVENDFDSNTIVFTLQNTTPDEFSLIGVHEYLFYFPLISR